MKKKYSIMIFLLFSLILLSGCNRTMLLQSPVTSSNYYINQSSNITNNITIENNFTNNITNNITYNITNNITSQDGNNYTTTTTFSVSNDILTLTTQRNGMTDLTANQNLNYKLNITDQRYNDTALIANLNSTKANFSDLANYYLASNPSGYITSSYTSFTNLQANITAVNNSVVQKSQVTACTTGQYSRANSTGGFECFTDQTGSGGTSTINYTTAEYATTDNAIYTVIRNLSHTLAANSVYLIDCRLLTYSAVATTGEQIQVNLSGTPTISEWSYNSQVSATTRTPFQGTSVSTNAFADTGSGGTNVRDTALLQGYVVTSSNPVTLTYALKSEISASNAAVARGSFCRYEKVI